MKIEMEKVSNQTQWSSATKTGLAALMGLAAISTMTSCDDSASSSKASEPIVDPNYSSDSSSPLEEAASSVSSATSSLSNQVVVDIPKSSSSFSDEVLSSMVEAAQSSSSEVTPASNEVTPTSSEVAPASSEVAPASSDAAPNSIETIEPIIIQRNSSDSNVTPWTDVYICPDGNCGGMLSMVTTFESTDLIA